MARTITADTFKGWWVGLTERAREEPDISRSQRSPAGVELNAGAALQELESCTKNQHVIYHVGLDADGQFIRRIEASSDAVELDPSGERGDEFVEDLIRNIVALTGIEPEYVSTK